jgi:hypothetical protein
MQLPPDYRDGTEENARDGGGDHSDIVEQPYAEDGTDLHESSEHDERVPHDALLAVRFNRREYLLAQSTFVSGRNDAQDIMIRREAANTLRDLQEILRNVFDLDLETGTYPFEENILRRAVQEAVRDKVKTNDPSKTPLHDAALTFFREAFDLKYDQLIIDHLAELEVALGRPPTHAERNLRTIILPIHIRLHALLMKRYEQEAYREKSEERD